MASKGPMFDVILSKTAFSPACVALAFIAGVCDLSSETENTGEVAQSLSIRLKQGRDQIRRIR